MIALDVVKLLGQFKSLLTSMKENYDGKEDLERIIKQLEEEPPLVDVEKMDRKSSILIATAKLMTKNDIDLSKLSLELPHPVKSDLKNRLKPYLSALQLDGYQKTKKRKAFVIGNTGKYEFVVNIYQSNISIFIFLTSLILHNLKSFRFRKNQFLSISKDKSG